MTDNPVAQRFAVQPDTIPGWVVWESPVNHLWHARKRGSLPVVLVHGDDLTERVARYREEES